jgi:hypothetical protein
MSGENGDTTLSLTCTISSKLSNCLFESCQVHSGISGIMIIEFFSTNFCSHTRNVLNQHLGLLVFVNQSLWTFLGNQMLQEKQAKN